MSIDLLKEGLNQASFERADNLLKDRITSFLGKQPVLKDLQEMSRAVLAVVEKADVFYAAALAAIKKEREFTFASTYARTTTKTALIDATFDFSKPGVDAKFGRVIAGNFGDLIVNAFDGVQLDAAALSHGIKRTASTEVTMPFGTVSDVISTGSKASLNVVEDNGRVLVYQLDGTTAVEERSKIFRVRHGRNSALTIAATLPVGAAAEVRVWNPQVFRYGFRMERAVRKMRLSQFVEECQPLIERYVPSAFGSGGAHSFEEWAADLDKSLDGKDRQFRHARYRRYADWADLVGTAGVPEGVDTGSGRSSRSAVPGAVVSAAAAAEGSGDVLPVLRSRAIRFATGGGSSDRLFLDAPDDECRHRWHVRPRQVRRRQRSVLGLSQPQGGARGDPLAGNTGGVDGSHELDRRDTEGHTIARREGPILPPTQRARLIDDALDVLHMGSPLPEFLGSLLSLEAQLIDSPVRSALAIAAFRAAAGARPEEALQHLAEFGEALSRTFNTAIGSHPLLSAAARPLASLLFVEASQVFDPSLAGQRLAALMEISVVKSGKVTLDQMLAGDIKDEDILHSQRFVEA